MSIQDPPYGDKPDTTRPENTPIPGQMSGQAPAGAPPAEGVLPAGDAARLREAGDTVRSDLNSAFETAKSDFRSLVDTAKRDLSAVKDEAVNQFQSIRGQASGDAQSLKDQASGQFQSLKDQAQGQYQNLKGEAESRIGDAAGRARSYAGEQVEQITDQARSFATQQKDLAAQQFGGVVDAVSRVAEELQTSQNGSAVAGYAQDFAGSLRGLADSIQNKSVDELFRDVQDFGKRQPLAFLGIAALAGFAASRFILASRNRAPEMPAAGTYPTSATDIGMRRFDNDVLDRERYRDPADTAVELDRTTDTVGTGTAGIGGVRGVADNGRI